MLLILGLSLNALAFAMVVMALIGASNNHTEDSKVMALIAIATGIIGSGLMS